MPHQAPSAQAVVAAAAVNHVNAAEMDLLLAGGWIMQLRCARSAELSVCGCARSPAPSATMRLVMK
jgi:hypothetical protein